MQIGHDFKILLGVLKKGDTVIINKVSQTESYQLEGYTFIVDTSGAVVTDEDI